ncbi:MAG: multiple antibiotic resistance protein [Candidatus Azotimanducaceae bacterium]|jgi:multiple antibiotic resistance protein
MLSDDPNADFAHKYLLKPENTVQNRFGTTFIVFFAVIDPIGTVPVFIAVTSHFDDSTRYKIALIATLAAAAVLIFFVVAGEMILNSMAIFLPAFQIAGGIVLFLFALSMIFGESKPDEEVRLAQDHHKTATPLATPSIAGPGSMLAAVLRTESSRSPFSSNCRRPPSCYPFFF